MLYKYSDFCIESVVKGYFHIFYENGEQYRLYYTKTRNFDSDSIKELHNLNHKSYAYISDGTIIVRPSTAFEKYDISFVESIENTIDSYVDDYANCLNPELYSLNDGDFIYLDSSIEQIQHNNPIMTCTEDEITIFDKADVIYPILIKEIKNQNTEAEIIFSGKAEGFENTNLYKSINNINKYNLFENAQNGRLILFYKDNFPYRLYFTKDKEFEQNLDPDLKGLSFKDAEHYGNEAVIYLSSEDRESKTFDIFDDSVCVNLENAVQMFIKGFENEHHPEIHILKDGEFIYLDFSDDELDHNSPIIFGISNDITIYDKAEELYPLIMKSLKESDVEAEFKFIKKAKGFENTNLYKSYQSINKYNLFENKTELYKYIVLQSHVDTADDYITIVNTDKPESSYPDDFICSIAIKLERPISIGEEIYVHISYVDDSIRFDASFDKKEVTKDFLDQYDALVDNKLLLPDEIFGRVSKIDAPKFLTTSDFLKSANDSIISKLNDGPEMYSFDDDTVYSVIDDKTKADTIKNIIWHDQNFAEKYDLLKSAQALKKFSI